MSSTKEYMEYILDQLSLIDGISCRAMMGEYILYYRDKVFGGIYDDRFMVTPVDAAAKRMPNAEMEAPYEGGKPMLLVNEVEDREFLQELVEAMYAELPELKKKRRSV